MESPDLVRLFIGPLEGDSGSERHRTDIEGILELSADRIDEQVLTSWAARLGLEDALREVRGA